MGKDIKNKKEEIGCIFVLIIIVLFFVSLTTDILNNIVGDEIAPWCKAGIFLLLVFFYGYYSAAWGKGPKNDREPSIASGLALVGIVIVFFAAFYFLDYRDGSKSNKTIIENGRYATDKSIKEKVVYYVTDGERYHKKSSCPSLHDSDIVYKAYITDVPEGRTPCGVCY